MERFSFPSSNGEPEQRNEVELPGRVWMGGQVTLMLHPDSIRLGSIDPDG